MAQGNSRIVSSNQTGPHEKLAEVVERHLRHQSQKPFSPHTQAAFEQAQAWLGDWQGELIFDSCCGVGQSTVTLAKQHPQAKVIGLDKSALRVNKHTHHFGTPVDNYLLLRADVVDFWRLAVNAGWQLSQHYLLYPNPYPKSVHLKRRWHGSPALREILLLGGQLTVRSNWPIYIDEFAQALTLAGCTATKQAYQAKAAMTAFEQKYWDSGQQSFQLVAQLSADKIK